ncbi:transcription initiation factor TFIID 23-30kDa subunit-domain-containing protein [Usnea florida]
MASPSPKPQPASAPDPPSTQLPSVIEDNELDPEIDMAIDPAPPDPENAALDETLPEPREATRKDISLRDFMGKMDDYAPIIPDAVTHHHLLLAGLSPHSTPLPLTRLLALATQKFIADIAADAYQYSRMRSSATGAGQSTGASSAAAAIPGGGLEGGGTGQRGGKDEKGGKGGQHVLGVQRAGYGGGGGGGGGAGQSGRAVLTMEDLGCAVGEYGVNVKRGEFYR